MKLGIQYFLEVKNPPRLKQTSGLESVNFKLIFLGQANGQKPDTDGVTLISLQLDYLTILGMFYYSTIASKFLQQTNSILRYKLTLQIFGNGWRLSTLVFCVVTYIMHTNIHNAQSWCERLASADVDQCTAMKSECTITVHFYKYNLFLFSVWLSMPTRNFINFGQTSANLDNYRYSVQQLLDVVV